MAYRTNSRSEAIARWRRDGGYLLYLGTGTYGVVEADELPLFRDSGEMDELERKNRNEIAVDETELRAAG